MTRRPLHDADRVISLHFVADSADGSAMNDQPIGSILKIGRMFSYWSPAPFACMIVGFDVSVDATQA